MPRSNQERVRQHSRMAMALNGHWVSGVLRRRKWYFESSYPDLAAKFNGAESTGLILTEFMRRRLLGGVTVRRLARDT